MEYVDGKAPLPMELDILWECDQYHCLPYPGGLMDQPRWLMRRMRAARNICNAWRAWRARKIGEEGKFAEDYPQYFSIVERYLDIPDNLEGEETHGE